MADLPILFSAPMVRVLLAGTKTQTRRLIKPQPQLAPHHEPVRVERRSEHRWVWMVCTDRPAYQFATGDQRSPIAEGDRLYVREEYYQFGHWEPVSGRLTAGGRQKWAFVADDPAILFSAPGDVRLGRHHSDPGTSAWHKRLGRFMPRWASRITLTVTDVRVERLQDISEEDALAEGVMRRPTGDFWVPGVEHPNPDFPYLSRSTAREMYAALWDVINGHGAWAQNPYVVAYTFTVALGNIDQIGRA
ncbi:Phage-related protein [Devosia sp. H5989]|nr:Phage-related protein [Devosia sp. H5989]